MKKKCIAFIAIASMATMLSIAGCGNNNANSKGGTDTVLNPALVGDLNESEKKELEEAKKEIEAELNEDATKAEAESKAEEPAEDLGIKDPKYYTYYEDLAKSFAESNITSYGGTYFYLGGLSEPVYANGKVYISNTASNKWILYAYDIAGGSLEKAFEFNAADSQKEMYSYDAWYANGDDLYLVYRETVYGEDHIEKVGKDGSIIEDYDISDGFMINQITYVFDNGKILLTSGATSNFEIYDPAENTLTQLDVIPVPSDHAGITQDAERPFFLFAKGNSFYFGDYRSNMNNKLMCKDDTIYEYNTDTNEATVFITDDMLKYESPEIEVFGDYLIMESGSTLNRTCSVVKLSDGTKIVDNARHFTTYFGGDGSYYRDTMANKWYKLRYPDCTYQGKYEKANQLIEAGEEISDESAKAGTVTQLNDKYYIVHDDAGFFLRTYEKGESDEQLIITQKQIDEDGQN